MADKKTKAPGSGALKKIEERAGKRQSALDAIFAQMPTNIKPKPGAKKVGDK